MASYTKFSKSLVKLPGLEIHTGLFSRDLLIILLANIQEKYGGNICQLQSIYNYLVEMNNISNSIEYLNSFKNLLDSSEETRKLWKGGFILGCLSVKESHDLFRELLGNISDPKSIICILRLSSQPGILTVTTTFQTCSKIYCPECKEIDCNIRHVRVKQLSEFENLFKNKESIIFFRTSSLDISQNAQIKFIERDTMILKKYLPINCSRSHGPNESFIFQGHLYGLYLNSEPRIGLTDKIVKYFERKNDSNSEEAKLFYQIISSKFNPSKMENWNSIL